MVKAILKQVLTDWRTILMVVLGVVMFGGLLLLDREHRVTDMIRSWGAPGILLAIALMMIWCLTPIPSEGLLVIFLRVFGVGWGTLYAWIGSTLSAVVIFYIARYFTRLWLDRVQSNDRFEQVNLWVKNWGSVGLLFARMLPVPAFIVNYVAGMIPAIGLWTYIWTAGISILPYYLGVALVFEGIFGNWIYALVAVIPLGLVSILGYVVRKKSRNSPDLDRRFSKWQ